MDDEDEENKLRYLQKQLSAGVPFTVIAASQKMSEVKGDMLKEKENMLKEKENMRF